VFAQFSGQGYDKHGNPFARSQLQRALSLLLGIFIAILKP
jgi:hypothetical protein